MLIQLPTLLLITILSGAGYLLIEPEGDGSRVTGLTLRMAAIIGKRVKGHLTLIGPLQLTILDRDGRGLAGIGKEVGLSESG